MFLFIALTAGGGELLLSVKEGTYMPLSLGMLWQHAHPDSFISLERMLMGTPLAWLWDPILLTVLACPAWIPPAILATICLLRGRKRRRRGVSL